MAPAWCGITTLYLHEGAPGHHFQISLAQENEALPSFMQFGGNTAFAEGWALYAETLGYDMGFYQDPIQRMGTLGELGGSPAEQREQQQPQQHDAGRHDAMSGQPVSPSIHLIKLA